MITGALRLAYVGPFAHSWPGLSTTDPGSLRSRFAGDEGAKPLAEFIDAICKEIRTKEIRQEVPQAQG